jgi:polar amino acid transport system substrate-binding protein
MRVQGHRRLDSGFRRYAAMLSVVAMAAAMWGAPALAAAAISTPPQIRAAGKIVYCSDITSPPLEYVGPNSTPVGSDIEIGNDIARRLGVKSEWRNTPFNGIVPALLAGHCDAIISQLFDKPERRQVVDMVDYMYSSEAVLTRGGNPDKIHTLDDLSGRKVAAENGTTIQALLQDENTKLKAAGKPPIEIVVFPTDTEALQQLQIGQVDAYGTTLESAAYYMTKAPGTFEVAVPAFHKVLVGIAVRKGDKALQTAIQQALAAMRADGTYAKILAKWHLEGDALQ